MSESPRPSPVVSGLTAATTTGRKSPRPPVSAWRFSQTLLSRDWRAGELRLLLVALAVAVAAISTVGFFIDRLGTALSQEATQLLGGDLVINADNPVPPAWRDEAVRRGLATATSITFPSMALTPVNPARPDELPASQLASIKATTGDYPLRGELTVSKPGGGEEAVRHGPKPGFVWADRMLLQSLGLAVGDSIALGDATLKVERLVLVEPDRSTSFINFAPRVMMSVDDLPATRLIQPGSRVTYRMLTAGSPSAVAGFQTWLSGRLGQGQRLETLETGRPDMRMTLDRSRQFLSLVSLLSALIAAVAIGLGARRFAERHLDGFAVLKSLGASQSLLLRSLLLEMLWIALAGAAVGAAVGWAAHWGLVLLAGGMLPVTLPPASIWPAFQAAGAGIVLVLGFAAVPILRLAGVPPLRVLRRDLGPPAASVWIVMVAAVLAFGLLLIWYSGDRRIALFAGAGFLGGALVFGAVTLLAVRLVSPLRHWVRSGPATAALRVALANWSRRRMTSVIQTAALAVGLMALMLLTVTRNDLLDSWRAASPADAPNRFVLNLQPDQRAAFEEMVRAEGLRDVELYPMIRGRLIAVNGRTVSLEDYPDERARRLVDREFNLSYGDRMPSHNQPDAGRWINPGALEVSAEGGIMRTLGLKLGDRLRFDVAGSTVEVALVGSRKLAWDSLKVNFFMIASPAALQDKPQSLITSMHLPAEKAELQQRLVERMPNLTVLDTTAILRQVQTMIDQVASAVQFLFLFALAAGVVVLYAALASSRDERVREAGLMRALGASRRQLTQAQVLELALSGLLAGILAAAGALVTGWLLASQVFEFAYRPAWWLLPAGALIGALFSAGAGWWSLRGVVAAPPMATLRGA